MTWQTSKKIFDEIVARTPVDTGVARASWNASLGSPVYKSVSQTIDGFTLPKPSFSITRASVRAGGKIFLTNSAPYIMELEYGWSGQAPHGMVRVTMAKYSVRTIVR